MLKDFEFITSLVIAISNCSLYSKEHETFDDFAKKAFTMLNACINDRFVIMHIDNELIVNDKPLREAGIHKHSLISRFKRKGISRVDFLPGVTLAEIKQFIADMAQGGGKGLRDYPHIVTGSVDVNIKASMNDGDGEANHSASEQVEKVKDIFNSVSHFKQMNIVGLEDMVGNFVTTFKREATILKLLCPVKSFDEYTYTHAANVAVLTIFQAETLGVEEEILREIGIGALLHDTGKMYVSKDILDKKGKLDDNEFAEIKKHTLFGARYLAKIDGLTRLAPIIAFEHHLKYDASGYPKCAINKRKQHIFSQIVAIADFFDALRSNRPYRAGMDMQEIFVLLKKGAGTDFNPFLVDSFISSIQKALAA